MQYTEGTDIPITPARPSKPLSFDPRTSRYKMTSSEGKAAFHTLENDWRHLWAQSQDATEVQSWDWQYLYWKHLAAKSIPTFASIRDEQSTCVCLASFCVTRDHASLLPKISFLGDHDADYHMILAARHSSNDIGDQIWSHLQHLLQQRASFIELSNIPQESWTGATFQRLIVPEENRRTPIRHWQTETYAVPLPATLEEYLGQLGSRSRRDFSYDRRRLAKEYHTELRICDSSETLDETLCAIEAIDKARWGSQSYYHVPAERALRHGLARAFCDKGLYRALVLYLDGKPAAFVFGTLVRDALKVARIAYDPSGPSHLSIGKVINFYAIEYAIEQGYKEYDLSRGAESYKKWLGAQPHINLHYRIYRNRFTELLEGYSTKLVHQLRNRGALRSLYRRLFASKTTENVAA